MALFESFFDVLYLVVVIGLGIVMIRKAPTPQYRFFGLMAVFLGCGDAFHLVPRVYAYMTVGSFAGFAVPLGIGKFVTSITMTLFYAILYHVWQQRYSITDRRTLTMVVYALAVLRIVLCLFPQNQWLLASSNWEWGIYRNIPFVLLGLIDIILFYQSTRSGQDKAFRFLWLAIFISFAMYVPVVLWSHVIPYIGMLMMPKTLAYVWIVYIGYAAMKKEMSSQ